LFVRRRESADAESSFRDGVARVEERESLRIEDDTAED
jgi:hypothetical protein